jgi:hypothetical protein
MDTLLEVGALGGGSEVAGAASEKLLEKECEKNACCPSLSLRTRLIVFAMCWGLGKSTPFPSNLFFPGIFFSVVGSLVLVKSLIKFVVCYTIGTILTIAGSFFLWGPMSQLKKAFDKDRWISSALLIVAICLTITSAFWPHKAILTLVLVILEWAAFIWYTICMLPYGKAIACACLKGC